MPEPVGRGLFRQKSLERLSSPERQDQLLEVVDRKSWIPLATLAALVLAIVVWSILGRIPVNVEGRGILVRPRMIVEVQAPGSGRVVAVAVGIGETVRKGQLLASIERPDLDERLRLQRQKALELDVQSRPGAPGSSGTRVRDHIEQSRANASILHEERLTTLRQERTQLKSQERVARDLLQSIAERLRGQRELAAAGLLSAAELDQAETDHLERLEQLHEIEAQRARLETASLEADEQYFDRLQRIAQWEFDLEQQIAEVNREVSALLQQLEESTSVVSDHDGRILELSVAPGRFLTAGERLGAMEVSDPSLPLMSLSYFRVGDGKRVQQGMKIHVTPDTVRRERYGSIVGVVRDVSGYPVSIEEATSMVGSRVVAQALIDQGLLIAVSSELRLSSADRDRYEWTSSRGPELQDVFPGTTTTARVEVALERPIALVLPLLKSAGGLE